MENITLPLRSLANITGGKTRQRCLRGDGPDRILQEELFLWIFSKIILLGGNSTAGGLGNVIGGLTGGAGGAFNHHVDCNVMVQRQKNNYKRHKKSVPVKIFIVFLVVFNIVR